MRAIESSLCQHCGKSTESNYFSDKLQAYFCCSGCEVVYKILNDHELTPYYSLRSKTNKQVHLVSENEYQYLDHPSIIEQYTKPLNSNYLIDFYLEGIHCLGCQYLMENLHRLNEDIISSRLNFETSLLTLVIKPETKLSSVASLLETLGYKPHLIKEAQEIKKHLQHKNKVDLLRIGVAGAVSGNIMLMAIAVYAGAGPAWSHYFDLLSAIIAIPAITFSAWPFYQASLQGLKQKKIAIDFPISLAIIIGSIFSYIAIYQHQPKVYFDSVTGLVFLLLSSRYIQKRMEEKALHFFQRDASFVTDFVYRLNAVTNEYEQIPYEQLQTEDRILVKTGTMIPADGNLISTQAYINDSLVTGESKPHKVFGPEKLYQGTLNAGDDFTMQVTAVGEKTRLSEILEKLKHQQGQSFIYGLSDRIGTYFLFTVFLLGLATISYFIMQNQTMTGIERALTLFIVTCPCALAIGTPLSFGLGFELLAKKGIILRHVNVMEKILQIRHIFLDKTGTLTQGQFSVDKFDFQLELTEEKKNRYLNLIYALEKESKHPVGICLKNYAEKNLSHEKCELKLESFHEILGKGVQAQFEKHQYFIGDGFYENDKLIATYTLKDELKPNTAFSLNQLKKLAIPLTILSGDQEKVVSELSRNLGIKSHAKLGPEAKAEMIKKHPFSMMVGDGANDALALKQAYLPVTIRGGLEMSLQVSDVYLANNDLNSLNTIHKTGKEIKKLIYRNLALSLIYNLTAATLAITGLIGPMLAAIFMPLSSLSVILSNFWGTKELRKLKKEKR